VQVFAAICLCLLVMSCGSATFAQEEPKAAPTATTAASPSATQAPQAQAPDPEPVASQAPVIYISDFELDALRAVNTASAKENEAANSASGAPSDSRDMQKEPGPAEQARELVDMMSTALIKELRRAGYTVRRLRPGQARPNEGIGIKGIFAEPDEQNRLRRAVLGAFSPTGKMALFVGVSNLARPEQALYAPANLPSNEKVSETMPGAIITVSSYAPVARFDVPKNVTEKAVKDTAAAIAADLTALLSANLTALTQ
jgi:hypothetical protein